jgi:anti-sigma factor (TIGR02949 family)
LEHNHTGCGDVNGVQDCESIFAKLQDFIDMELSEEEIRQVEIHLNLCPPCAVEYRFEASVLRYMKGGFCRMQVPEDLEKRCLKALADEEA